MAGFTTVCNEGGTAVVLTNRFPLLLEHGQGQAWQGHE